VILQSDWSVTVPLDAIGGCSLQAPVPGIGQLLPVTGLTKYP
jgi:hypothetical protein